MPIEDTVVTCSGLLGGSGSNPVGYRCWGTFTVDGHRYTKDIPGNVLRTAGTKVLVIADTEDPGLITTPSLLASEHASSGVFILPAVLFGVRRRYRSECWRSGAGQPAFFPFSGFGRTGRFDEAERGV